MQIDVIIILGKGVYADGSIPRVVQNEIDAALRLCREQDIPAIIFSGKYWGLQRRPAHLTEAATMKQYARSRGAAHIRLVSEEKSQDTIGAAVFTRQIVDRHSWKNVLVFCTQHHLPRAQYIFNRIYGSAYTIQYRACAQQLSRRQYWHMRRYEWLAWRYARWVFRRPWLSSSQQQQHYLRRYDFMYHRSALKQLLRYLMKRSVHRHP